MKRIIRVLTVTSLLVVSVSLSTAYSQPSPGNQSGGNDVGGTPIGGGSAPVGSGLFLLIALASGYGAKKIFASKMENED